MGVVLGGRLVEERLWRERRKVTIGESQANTLVVPGAGIRTHALFVPSADGWTLAPPAGAFARLADAHGIRGVEGAVPIPPGARGRVVVGDATVLFQELEPRPEGPRPRLPVSIRAPWWTRIDAGLAVVLFISLAVHAGCIGYLQSLDFPSADWSAPPLPRYVGARFSLPEPRRTLPERTPERPERATAAPGSRSPRPSVRAAAPLVDEATRRARLAEQVQKSGVLLAITARGEEGAVADVLRSGYVAADAEEVFARVGAATVATTAAPALHGSRPGQIHGGRQVLARGPNDVASGDRGDERAIRTQVTLTPPPLSGPDGPLLARLMAETRERMGAARACYEASIRHGEARGGKLTLRMTVSPIGKVTEVAIDEDTLGDAEVARCISGRVRSWRFGALPRELTIDFDLVLVPIR